MDNIVHLANGACDTLLAMLSIKRKTQFSHNDSKLHDHYGTNIGIDKITSIVES